MEVSGTQMILGLVIGVALLIFLILRTKVHAFAALILAAATTGLIGGMNPTEITKAITAGFGNTLSTIGIVIGFGVMMGRILEVSGAAERMALTFLKYLGRKNPEWAMGLTGYFTSIPIFCDSGFVILQPLAKALSRKSGKSILTMGVSLAIGLSVTHHLVPPTPGPLGAAGIMGADVGAMIGWGVVFSIPVLIIGILYAQWLGRKMYQVPAEDGEGWERKQWSAELEKAIEIIENKALPSAAVAFAPILLPVALILTSTILTAMKLSGGFYSVLLFLGHPIIAVLIGLLLAIYGLTGKTDRKDVIKQMEEGVKSAGIILLVTGAGGALGNVLRVSGAGNYVADLIAGTAMPAILLPFLVATLVRLVQGSGTVAMLTGASITAPIMMKLGVSPVFAAQSAAIGSFVFSYFNDSYFWVVNRMLGIEDVKEQILTWSVPSTIAWGVSAIMLVIANAFFG